MEARRQKLLNLVIDSYTKTAEPVGSRFLLSAGNLDCGEATIRNELRLLEEEGYLTHPHTSAGRVPTEKGYRHYVNNLDKNKIKLSKKENNILGLSIKEPQNYTSSRKNLAKALSHLSTQAVLIAFSPDSIYYTGLSNLFSKPEFNQLELVAGISQVFDHCEQCLEKFYDDLPKNELLVLVGANHPFGDRLSVLASKFSNQEVDNGLAVMLGPMRMDYKHNWSLMSKTLEII
ncbi:MAG: hypothetical protein COU31_02480 [Candidatus Magasanikbacteria bacterium CG10_big_fil_rev_8_21_14_0_10_40_10]|uniref:Heat-inducible transcription repressor HrcA C-terminal domain-containing protein n=1 Tax=Candidatus Magasanikbacteria bacterium CG10_big_fil_rev_8_21_14_0_10_40_10 TaxID=1974648 RepID=A0A2M6W409_9BACT|nr:MAG: hypothetical protein COU31_02480 [Candidatus Magasanikbacteria bacterium CG10_big_fil_rev_8_21_14_0_10_40_10]